jgi:hypothetical protein
VRESPVADFFLCPIGMAVVVRTIPVTLVQPLLVLTLELVVEHDAFDVGTALGEPLCMAFVGAIDLEVVPQLALAFDAVVEGLAVSQAVFTDIVYFIARVVVSVANTGGPVTS